MTITQTLDKLQAWFDEKLCQKLTLKLPTDNTIDGTVEFVHPATFALYVPAKDRIPPNVQAPIPSLLIQIMDGDDRPMDHLRKINVRLCLATWSPGIQTSEMLVPREEPSAPMGYVYHQGQEPVRYMRGYEGWRDIWNFIDSTLALLEREATIAGMRIVKEDGISYGPFTEDGAIWDYYPYWHSWVKFGLECGILAQVPEIEELL